ncbi:MAG: ParB/RepB/Spo0J family partition protein [Clostridia bacterium]|jgi:ParB family chromosome partitioning protein|nr:ParB/RepB/Spo0J family partition protein [Clostridia bacterium]
MAKKGLGKGLGALLIDNPQLEEEISSEKVLLLPIEKVEPNPNQPRKDFPQEFLQELVNSVRERGILQPLLVRPQEGGTYQIIAGERRYRAANIAGLKQIPCVVRLFDDNTTLEVALIENIQRQDLNAIEEALCYKELMDTCSYSHAELAEKVGKSRVYITNTLRLLNLPEEALEHLKKGEISAGHGRVLLQINKLRDREALLRRILAENLSVRQCERLAKNPALIYGQPENKPKLKREKIKKETEEYVLQPEILLKAEAHLRQKLGTKVQILPQTSNTGKINIEYYNNDDLQRLIDILLPDVDF